MKRSGIAAVLLLVFGVIFFAGCSKEKESLKIKRRIAARVKDTKITEEEVAERFDKLPPAQKDGFEGKEGKIRFVEMLIEEQVIYQAALDKKMHLKEDVSKRIEQAKRTILLNEYYSREVLGKVEIKDEEIKEYYDSNNEEFMTRPLMRGQQIFSKDSLKAVSWLKRVKDGENFSKIAKNESEDDVTAIASGSLGYFNPGGYIKSVGYSQMFSTAVETLEVDDVALVKFEKGYSVVKINEKNPATLPPLSEVRKRIDDKLRQQKAKTDFRVEVERLRKKYNPENYMSEKIEKTIKTSEELWEMAQLEEDSYQRINYYRELVGRYPDHKYAPQALFMIGFVYAEEIQDLVQARRTFDELIRDYPDAEVVDSARWMIENLKKPHPKFESVEEMKKSMMDDKGEE